jgi:hypothetical protein
MRALLSIPSQILQIRAQTGDRQEIFWSSIETWRRKKHKAMTKGGWSIGTIRLTEAEYQEVDDPLLHVRFLLFERMIQVAEASPRGFRYRIT